MAAEARSYSGGPSSGGGGQADGGVASGGSPSSGVGASGGEGRQFFTATRFFRGGNEGCMPRLRFRKRESERWNRCRDFGIAFHHGRVGIFFDRVSPWSGGNFWEGGFTTVG